MSRIGIFGGTFDPIHNGHLFIAEESADRLGLDRVVFVPSHVPPHRSVAPAASPGQRMEMVKLATAPNSRFETSDIELRRDGASYTVDTLASLQSDQPGAELYFIVGMDSLTDLPNWRDPDRIVSLARLVAVERGGEPQTDLKALEAQVPSARGRIDLLSGLGLEVSSTEVRRRLAAGLTVRYLVPDAVIDFIAAQGLYRD